MLSEENNNASAVCAAVRLDIESVRDGRASEAERAFVTAHIAHCSGCASEWALARATKLAWQQMPTAHPPASLSARIAAATYRKPTFAQRLVSAFAFLNPAPVRVAIGVVAVAGIAFFALPRQGAMIAQNSVAQPESKPETVDTNADKNKVAPAKSVVPKSKSAEPVKPVPVVVAVKPAPKPAENMKPPVIAAKRVVVAKTVVATVLVVKTAPKPLVAAPAPVKKPATQVAIATKFVPVKPVRVAPTMAETAYSAEKTLPVAPVKTAPVVVAIEKPVAKEPVPVAVAAANSVTVGERESLGDGFIRLGSQLPNAGRGVNSRLLRGSAVVAQNNPTFGIVNSAIK